MKYKNFVFVCLIIFVFISLSSVYASDVNDTNITQNEPVIELSNAEGDILNSNYGTFSDLNNEIQNTGSELKLTKNYKYSNEDSEFTNGIQITKPITIDGNGFTITGDKIPAFNIRSSMVVLKNIKFENCYGKNGGSIIFVNVKNCEIINSTFTNNHVWSGSDSNGGALFLASSDLKIENTIFNGNKAGDKGGCIYASSSNLNIRNSIFNGDNFVHNLNSRGGCIYARLSKLNIDNTTFNGNNYAAGYGGSIYASDSTLTINSSNFTKNHADDGGCIYASSSNLIINNTIFINNWANREGGAIFVYQSTLIMSASNFTKNQAKYGGSAIDSLYSTGGLINCYSNNTLINGQSVGLKNYTTELEVTVNNNIVDITVINPDFFNGYGYFLAIEKYPFSNTHDSWSTKDSLKLYNNHTTTFLNYNQIGLNQYRVYYSNFIKDFYYYFNVTETAKSTISVEPITSIRGTNTVLKIIINDPSKYSKTEGGYVEFTIDGTKYNYPVKDGESELTIKMPKNAGTFNYKVTFYPYSEYIFSSSTNLKITSKYGTKITIKSVSGYQGKKVKLTAIVKDDNGNKIKSGKVTFKIGGKTYSAKVKKGIARITIKYPKAKWDTDTSKTKGKYRYETSYYKSTYVSSVTFNGAGEYSSSSKTFNVISKKKPIKHKYRIYNYRTFTLPVKKTLKFYYKGSVVLAVGMKSLTTKNKLIIGVGDENDYPIKFKVKEHYKKNGKWKWKKWFKCGENQYVETTYGKAIKIDKIKIRCYSPYFVKIY